MFVYYAMGPLTKNTYIRSSQHRHQCNGHRSQDSTHCVCNPKCMIQCQHIEHCQAILAHFLCHSNHASWLHWWHWRSPTDDRQRRCRYHPILLGRQYPSPASDGIFRLFLFCCSLNLPIWSSSLSRLQEKHFKVERAWKSSSSWWLKMFCMLVRRVLVKSETLPISALL